MINLKIKRKTKVFYYRSAEPVVFDPKEVKEIYLNQEDVHYILVEK